MTVILVRLVSFLSFFFIPEVCPRKRKKIKILKSVLYMNS